MNWFQRYANAGISVLPIKLDMSKSPAVASWNKYRNEIANDWELRNWHEQGYGVGLIGGDVSGGLEIVDIDDPSLVRPYILAVREADPALLDSVAFVATPRRDPETGKTGCHVLFRSQHCSGNTKLAMSEPLPQFDAAGEPLVSQVSGEQLRKPETLIETRGEGGYVLTVGCPPECHESGNLYEHRMGCPIEELTTISAEQRLALLQAGRMLDRSVASEYTPHEHERHEETPGHAWAATATWEEILEPHGWRKAGTAGNTQRWLRPGKPRGWSATSGLVSQYGNQIFCVFSTNAHPFPGPEVGKACSTHSKFDAFTRLNFDGDYSAAAKHLANRGFGEQPKRQDDEPRKPVTFATWDDVTRDYMDVIENGGDTTLSTGLRSLDDAIGGLAFGELVIIGGRPSHGKTLLALQLADGFACDGMSSLLISEEMSGPMLAKRRLHMATDFGEDVWRSHWPEVRIDYADFSAKRAPIYIAPQCGTVDRAEDVIEAANENELRVVIVDYAQLLRGKGRSKYEQVSDVSQRLREATSKYEMLIIALCQLNRESEKQGRPKSMDLRDSGQLEQDADVILLVDWLKMRTTEYNHVFEYWIYAEKNRNREIKQNRVELRINPRRQRVEERPDEWIAEPGEYEKRFK